MSHLTCDDIRQTLKQGATLLDVRNSTEFNNSCLPNAKNIPLATLPALADSNGPHNLDSRLSDFHLH